ncbi:hypothetical protein QWY85_18355 [Neolewinella lacunae]|uniref:Uncharacterized protein n=1 Tax=Neolewinella lacunae TaxID=1517758 RepID=A0A923PS55_9BACT|nr:hypothetical protein [Neolewinella lacunae]MBC6996483.1 hypothetical protein [Neolewinella lacunae]MDN3636636.1 hypothetical protein [Neolewinella lacunae]
MFLFCGLLIAGCCLGQPSLFDHLHANAACGIRLTLGTDLGELRRSKAEKAYLPSTFQLQVSNTLQLELPGQVRTRGNVRLQVCDNPSLKVKFKKAALRAAGFSDLNEWKIVLQCSDNKVGAGYLRRERFVYELHALYSSYHHRTVPVTLVFGPDTTKVLEAFLVEDEEQLAHRYQSNILNAQRVSTQGIHRPSYVNLCLFNYLILNTDWHISNLHNVEVINPRGTNDLVPIPYDFDYAGFVGTSYAVPRESLGIRSIYDPKWLGKNISNEELLPAIAHFEAVRPLATELINRSPDLEDRDRQRMLKRLDAFHKVLASEDPLRLLEK